MRCPGVMGSWLPLAVFIVGIIAHRCYETLSMVCAKSCEGLCKEDMVHLSVPLWKAVECDSRKYFGYSVVLVWQSQLLDCTGWGRALS